MGKVDQGVFTPLAARPPARAAADLHRLRGYWEAGARPAARRRPLRADPRAARRPRGAGTARRSTSAAGSRVSLSLRETTDAVPRADRQRGADRAGAPSRARATCRSTRRTAARCSRAPTWRPARGPRTILEDTLAWIEANERRGDDARWADGRDRGHPAAPPARAAAARPSGSRSPGCSSLTAALILYLGRSTTLLLRRVELRARAPRVGRRRAAQAAQRAPLGRPGADLQGALLDAGDRRLRAVPGRRRGRAPDRARAAVRLRAAPGRRRARARRRGR